MPQPSLCRLLAEHLRAIREHHGLTQEKAAHLIGCDYKYYQRIEAGAKDIRLSTLERIAKALGVDSSELVGPLLSHTKANSAGKTLKRIHRKDGPLR